MSAVTLRLRIGSSTTPTEALVERSGFSGTAPIERAAAEFTARSPLALVGPTLSALKFSSASVGARKPLLIVPRIANCRVKS